MTNVPPEVAHLKELKKDLLEMDEAELLAKIREIRDDRKITKAPPKSVKKKAESANKMEKFLASLPPDQLKAFMEKLK